jgi:hypothetical protein
MVTTHRFIIAVLIGVMLTFLSACSVQYTERRPPKEKWMIVTIQGMVESIDMKAREVTLKGSRGNLVTLEVDERVKRLDEVSVGDVVSADYWAYMKAEFRDPTPLELTMPLVVLSERGKTPEGIEPATAVGAVVQAVVTIVGIDQPRRQVTIKGPRGKYATLPVEDQALLEDIKIGEIVVLIYAEAVAFSLKKVKP